MAFVSIVYYVVRFPSLRRVAEIVCEKRNEHIEAVATSWKRPGVEYDSLWTSYYKAALRCLLPRLSLVMSAITNLDVGERLYSRILDFSQLGNLLACCRYATYFDLTLNSFLMFRKRDKTDTMIAVEYMCWIWNRKGRYIFTIVKTKKAS